MLSANLQKLKKKALVDLAQGLSIPIHFLSLRGFSIKEGPYTHDCHTLGMKPFTQLSTDVDWVVNSWQG